MAIDKLQELQEQRNKLAGDIRSLNDELQGKDEWSSDDESKWESLNADYDSVLGELDDLKKRADYAARVAEIAERDDQASFNRRSEIGESRANRNRELTEEIRYRGLQGWLKRANDLAVTDADREAMELCGIENRGKSLEANMFLRSAIHGCSQWYCKSGRVEPTWNETRAMSVGTPADGGYTVPEGFMAELERSMLQFGNVRGLARIIATASGNDVPWPTVTDHGNVGAILTENNTMGSSVDPTFSVVTLKAYKYSSTPVLVSQELIEDSAFNLGVELGSMLGERIARITNQHFTTGDNSSKPQGVAYGAGTGVTAASATAITADELIDLQESLDAAYQMLPSVGFMFHQSTRKAIRKLKDGESNYLWQPGLRAGEPDLLLGKPYSINNDMAEIATSNHAIVYGAFEKYIVRDVAAARFYRLEERYRDNDQTGFVLFSRHDGRICDAGTDPFKKLVLA